MKPDLSGTRAPAFAGTMTYAALCFSLCLYLAGKVHGAWLARIHLGMLDLLLSVVLVLLTAVLLHEKEKETGRDRKAKRRNLVRQALANGSFTIASLNLIPATALTVSCLCVVT